MKKSQLKEIKNLEIEKLKTKIKKVREELATLMVDREPKGKRGVFEKRKELAWMLTILRQKELIEELRKEA